MLPSYKYLAKETAMITYKYEDIFHEDPDNPDDLLMTIPPEILEEKGWSEGTKVKISIGDQGTLIIEEVKESDG